MPLHRVVLLTNILPPYRVDLFNALGRCHDYAFTIAFLAEREANRRWRVRADELTVKHLILPGWSRYFGRLEIPLHINWGVYGFLKRENPDAVIVGGYAYPASWVALLYCRFQRRRLVLWSGTTDASVRVQNWPIQAARRAFVRGADAFVTYGVRAAEFLMSLGAKRKSIFVGTNVGDVHFFKEAVQRHRETHEFRRERAELAGPVILFVGQLIPRKGLTQLLSALSANREKAWTAFIVGDGPLRSTLEAVRKQLELVDRVHFVPFQEREVLVRFYSLADIFVLPSLLEVGAIVVSEALASGLFVLASAGDGVAPDLIRPGRTGLLFNPLDTHAFSAAIGHAIQVVSLADVRNEIVMSMALHTPEHYADTFCRALDYAVETSTRLQGKTADAVGTDR